MLTRDLCSTAGRFNGWGDRPWTWKADVLCRWLTVLTVAGLVGTALWLKNGASAVLSRAEVVAASAAGTPVAGRRSGFPYLAETSSEEEQARRRQLVQWRDKLQRASKLGAEPAVLWQAALVELAAGSPERAVRRFEAAVAAPAGLDRAQVLNDLAVAYLARSEKLGQPRDLVRALDAAGRAAEAGPALPEPCFNKAL